MTKIFFFLKADVFLKMHSFFEVRA